MTWRPYRWDDYNVDLVDSSLVTIGHLNEAHMLAYDWSSFGHGKAVLALHKDSQQAQALLGEEQFYIKVIRAGVHVRDFMVAKDDHGYTVDDQDIDEYVKLILSPLDMFLAQDFCQPETAAGTFETPSLAIDDAFKWIVDHTFGPNAYDSFAAANRTRTGLTIAADLGDHPTTQVIDVCNGMNVFEFLQRFGPNWDVDWRLRLEITAGKQNQMVFETFYPRRGLDKTESNFVARIPVLINDASVNVPRARKYRETASMVNVWVKDDLSGETADAASVAAWGRRAARAPTNVSDKLDTLIENKGIEEGQEYGFHPSEQCQLGEDDDFVVGDLVTVGNAHVGIAASDQPIKGALIEIAETGEETISLTFGQYEKTLGDKIDEAGGGGSDEYYPDPLHGLHDNSDVWVPLSNDDFRIWIKLACVDGSLTIVGDYATNTITFSVVPSEVCYWDRNVNDAEVYTATASDDVVPNGGTGTIGQSDDRWPAGYFVEGDFSGDVTIDTGGKGIVASNNTVGYVLVSDGTRYIPDDGSGIAVGGVGHWTVGSGFIRTTVANKNILSLFGTGTIGSAPDRWDFYYGVAASLTATMTARDVVVQGGTVQMTDLRHIDWQNDEYIYGSSGRLELVAATGQYVDISIAGTSQLRIYDGVVRSQITNNVDLGTPAIRFKAIYGIAGNFTGDVTIDTGGKGLIMSDVTAGKLLIANGTRYVPGSITDIATHDHGGSTGSTQPALSGYTTSFDIKGFARVDGGANVVRDYSGNGVFFRTYGSQADAENDVNETGEQVGVGATPHVHNLSGNTGYQGSEADPIEATATVADHAHAIVSAL